MKHASARELYNYWNRLRGTEKAPPRSAVEPSEIRAILGDTFLLEVLSSTEYRFRLAGTRICSAFCGELKGKDFLAFWTGEDRISMATLLHAVTVEAAAGSLEIEAENDRGQPVHLEALVLPLRQDFAEFGRVVGVLAPNQTPYWLGIHPITRLTITNLRILRPSASEKLMPVPRLVMARQEVPAADRRNSFVVVEGGKR